MSNLELVSVGLSSILGTNVVPQYDGGFSVEDLFSQTYVMTPAVSAWSAYPPLADLLEEESDISVSDSSSVFSFRMKGKHTIRDLKTQIGGKYGTTADSMKLLYRANELQDSQTVAHYRIQPDDKIHLLKRNSANKSFSYGFNINDLDPKFDYDFTQKTDDGKQYMRGGFEYKRPYGWNRIATKVLGKYTDDVWLGPKGKRTNQSPGEWPVSYHGTNMKSAKKIIKKGYKVGPRDKFGKGIYSSPSLEMVERMYAQGFTHNGQKYKIALQNRVNPDQSNGRLEIISASETGVGADYWLSPERCDVRPYGILIRQMPSEGHRCQLL